MNTATTTAPVSSARNRIDQAVDAFEGPGGHVRRQPVVHPGAFPAGHHDPAFTKLRKVAGDGRLGGAEQLGQFAHADVLARADQRDQRETQIVSQASAKLDGGHGIIFAYPD